MVWLPIITQTAKKRGIFGYLSPICFIHEKIHRRRFLHDG
eukprot:UN01264